MLKRWMIEELYNMAWNERGKCRGVLLDYEREIEEKKGVSFSRSFWERKEYWEVCEREMCEIINELEEMLK